MKQRRQLNPVSLMHQVLHFKEAQRVVQIGPASSETIHSLGHNRNPSGFGQEDGSLQSNIFFTVS